LTACQTFVLDGVTADVRLAEEDGPTTNEGTAMPLDCDSVAFFCHTVVSRTNL
jgi:hypothetical protein